MKGRKVNNVIQVHMEIIRMPAQAMLLLHHHMVSDCPRYDESESDDLIKHLTVTTRVLVQEVQHQPAPRRPLQLEATVSSIRFFACHSNPNSTRRNHSELSLI